MGKNRYLKIKDEKMKNNSTTKTKEMNWKGCKKDI